jgi:hypothetical protein
MNGSSVNPDLVKNIHNFSTEGSRLKWQWLHDQVQCSVDNPNNVGCKASRHLRNKKREYLKSKVNEPEIDNKNKNIIDLYTGINN